MERELGYYWIFDGKNGYSIAQYLGDDEWVFTGSDMKFTTDPCWKVLNYLGCDGEKPTSELNTKALPLHGVVFSEDCDCVEDEVCGICFRKKGWKIVDNNLIRAGEAEVCSDIKHKPAHSTTGFCSICQCVALIPEQT